jgi:integrase
MALRYKDLEVIAARQRDAWTPDGAPNLYAFARASGNMSWVARVVIGGKRVNLTIGPWPKVKGEAARAAAAAVKGLVKAGHGTQAIRNALAITIEPLALAQIVTGERVSGKSATPTFAEVATKWFDEHASGGISNDDYRRQVFQQVRDYAFPALGERPVNAIKRAEIVDAIRSVWLGYETVGKRLRGNIERILDYAVDRGWCEFNVCPPVRSMPSKARIVRHHAALAPERGPELWAWIRQADLSPASATALSLALLTGKRSGEIRMMEWDHLDLDRGITVTIPPEKRDKQLSEKLKVEGHAILRWAIDGALKWQERGLDIPAKVVTASTEYMDDEDILGQFISDEVLEVCGHFTRYDDLYQRFSQWAEAKGLKPWTQHTLVKELKTRGFQEAKSNGRRGLRGLKLS